MQIELNLVHQVLVKFCVSSAGFLQSTSHIPHPRPCSTEGPTNGEPGGVCTQG